MNKFNTPIVTKMQVIPVAGYDSMLMTLSGAHASCFTRNLVLLQDNTGHTGIGEIHGGDYTCSALRGVAELVEGQPVVKYRSVLDKIHKAASRSGEDDGEGIQSLDISKLKFVVKAEWAIECALLDLLGQYLGVPMCELLGNGRQRDQVETLGYLFYVEDKDKAPRMNYLDESQSKDPWFRLRRKKMMTPERIALQADTLHGKYGFQNFKLKGGVLPGDQEMEAVRAVKKEFPQGRVNIDPNGAWSLKEAVEYCRDMHGILTYVEDPCGPEQGFSGREILSEFKNATHFPVATNMIATDWRQFYHAATLKSVDIVLADPHFWGFGGSVRMAQILQEWGLTWGIHSNNHFDITLAAYAHVAAAVPGKPAPIDTHWIWQDGQNLLKDTPKIRNGFLEVPEGPGLGVTLDTERVEQANKLYNTLSSHDRDDSVAMQYLIPGWKFDSKKPALVRP
ncbi:glucarate dehydratase [Caproiciproducens sp. NJN-50]|uniref:enolase C-terminal domain-like protein n=1 Tax=Acutalibacteraceae TaxID=3082771 RepID=UPI000FFE084B|nr:MULTISPECIES: enolase C-terminal domain-like protein [Acutalibacteraceae]QAT48754.1 glucarate dehydratase [Caproiciproducens sp. NJN-50]